MKNNMLEFSDWPMFDHVMMDEELCSELLEVVLGRSVSRIEYIVAEQDIRPTFGNHGVRLDAFVKGENEVYDVEMQTTKKKGLGRRLRYYQGSIDTLSLQRGDHYETLPPCYIVFICSCDPFGGNLPVYTLDVKCSEQEGIKIEHGFQWIVLSAPAWAALPPGRLRNLLHYVMTGEPNGDDFTERLAAAVSKANENELWRREKMEMLTFEEDLEIQKAIAVAEARAEAIAETEEKFASLANALLAAGREGDVARAATDPKIREALYREFDLND